MSAIGDYVHLTWEGYVNGHKNPSNPLYNECLYRQYNANNIHQRIKAKAIELNAHEAFGKRLEEALNGMFGIFTTKEKEENMSALLDTVINDMRTNLEETLPRYTLTETLKVIDLKGKKGEIDFNKTKIKEDEIKTSYLKRNTTDYIDKANTTIHKETINRRLLAIKAAIESKGVDGKKIINEYNEIVNVLERFGENIQLNIEQNNGKINRVWARAGIKKASGKIIDFHNKDKTGILDKINHLLRELFTSQVAKLTGEVGEEITAIGAKQLAELGITKVADAITIGDKGGLPMIDTGLLSANATLWVKNKKTNTYKGNKRENKIAIGDKQYLILKSSETQDKTDVQVTLESGENIFLSVKNVNLSPQSDKDKGIKLVSGSPFLYMIQYENTDNFINHWMNITIQHEDNNFPNKTIQKTHLYMKQILLLNALAAVSLGRLTSDKQNQYFQYSPDLFVLIDNNMSSQRTKTARVKVYPMGSLFNFLARDIDRRVDMSSYMEFIRTEQPWNKPYQREDNPSHFVRINKILSALYNAKIEILINKEQIRKTFSMRY